MIYIDTNVFVYAIENHPKYGSACKKILVDIENGKADAACSTLVLAELLNVLVKLRKLAKELDVKTSIAAVTTLQIKWLDMDFFVIENASDYNYNISGADYVHIATMKIHSINKILSADSDFDKVDFIERIDPLNY